MPIWVVILIAVVAGIAAGALAGYLLRSASAKADIAGARAESAGFEALAAERGKLATGLREELLAKVDVERNLAARVSALEAELRNERQNLAEKLALLETAKKALADQFQALAADILDQKSKAFSEGSQKEIGNLLGPLKTQIEDFKKKVEEAQTDSKTGVATLQGMVGSLTNLNQKLAEDARNLTTALRGSAKAQGDWGEFILRDLLEKAGLREGEQYSFQQSFTGLENEDGTKTKTKFTDVIVFLPGGRNLVIDSKVSLTAYTDYANVAGDAERSAALKLHLASVRGHVAGLAKAGYQRLPGLETPDFVVMFVPVEPAFLLALQNDAALWADAYEQGILLVGPTTLLYIIRIVNVLWEQEKQARNVKDVMDRGAKLYEKFVGFIEDLEKVGKGLRDATQSYENARKKLSLGDGNLVRQVEMLKELGIRTSKSPPQSLLESASADEPTLALAAEADDAGKSEA